MKPTWAIFFAMLTGASVCGPVNADFVGINIGAGHWSPSLSGSFNSRNGGTSIDLDDDLGINDESQTSLVLTVEHPIQILPNIRYQGFALDSSGVSTLNNDLTFNGETFNSGNRVRSSFNLSHDDLVLYYQLLDNWIDLDMGVDLKRFDGEVELSGDNITRVDVDETIPMLYLSARYDFPYSGFYIGANIRNLSLSDSTAEDSTFKLGYESSDGLGFEGGIKTFSLELDDANNLDTDIKYDGIFLNGYYNF
ncbi:MAG: TIGR04219 family outer membrane beta-barrel protein [Gammaproteobacteria bacterium]|nr:TIGR04219 family outer membrane beta-barrel protein [Gammaproteobacteria bacterium]